MEDETVVEGPTNVLETKQSQCTGIAELSSLSDDASAKFFQAVLSFVKKDLVAADVKWTLFVAASQSYKHDSCLRPFPPMFVNDGNKDVSALMNAIESVPAFIHLESSVLTKPAILLLHWVLLGLKEPSLLSVAKSEVEGVLSLVSCDLPPPKPSLVVRLAYDPSTACNRRWHEAESRHGSIYAFHGSRVDNFHSIIHHGLQQHLTTNALFGQGVYLSSELLVCLPYSRTGLGWKHSCLGSACSVVAMCQVIDHPSILCQNEQGSENNPRAMADDSMAGEVPHKLYVVPNSDLIRVKYLLVYTQQTPPSGNQRLTRRNFGILAWLGRHKMVASLVAYALLLASVGLSRSPTAWKLWRDICHAIGLR